MQHPHQSATKTWLIFFFFGGSCSSCLRDLSSWSVSSRRIPDVGVNRLVLCNSTPGGCVLVSRGLEVSGWGSQSRLPSPNRRARFHPARLFQMACVRECAWVHVCVRAFWRRRIAEMFVYTRPWARPYLLQPLTPWFQTFFSRVCVFFTGHCLLEWFLKIQRFFSFFFFLSSSHLIRNRLLFWFLKPALHPHPKLWLSYLVPPVRQSESFEMCWWDKNVINNLIVSGLFVLSSSIVPLKYTIVQ